MWVFLPMMLLSLWPVAASTARSDAKPGCQEKCGNVSVPYPFGILEPSCAMNDYFFLNCNSTDESHPELLFAPNMPISNISELEGTVTVGIDAAFSCYNKTGIQTDFFQQQMTLGSARPFMFSHTRNIFTAIAYDTLAVVTNYESTYGAASDKSSLKISDWPLSRTAKYGKDAYATDVVIEWVVENKTCEKAKANTSAYSCGTNAYCTDPDEIDQGYRCLCNKGFEGNPYLKDGCQ
ncbi:hypothetical protein OIU79_021832, partial [Salix purpurea]